MSLPARLHAAAGAVALLTILGLQTMIALGETSGHPAEIAALRSRVVTVVCVLLVPAMIAAGASGARLGRGWRGPLIAAKRQRMRAIAALGLLVLLPLAVGLWGLAARGMIDGRFVLLQRLETLAGLVNLLLLGLNLRDGMRLRRRPAAT